MKTASMEVKFRITFRYDENRNDEESAAGIATDLFLNPCYTSIADGVCLLNHEIIEQEEA